MCTLWVKVYILFKNVIWFPTYFLFQLNVVFIFIPTHNIHLFLILKGTHTNTEWKGISSKGECIYLILITSPSKIHVFLKKIQLKQSNGYVGQDIHLHSYLFYTCHNGHCSCTPKHRYPYTYLSTSTQLPQPPNTAS